MSLAGQGHRHCIATGLVEVGGERGVGYLDSLSFSFGSRSQFGNNLKPPSLVDLQLKVFLSAHSMSPESTFIFTFISFKTYMSFTSLLHVANPLLDIYSWAHNKHWALKRKFSFAFHWTTLGEIHSRNGNMREENWFRRTQPRLFERDADDWKLKGLHGSFREFR